MATLTKNKEFPCISLMWADIDLDEYDENSITDEKLQRMARAIGDGMMESGAWPDALEAVCDTFLTKKKVA